MSLRLVLALSSLLSGCFVTETELDEALDRDNDGFIPVQTGGDDCDEGRADVNPAAPEICNDGIDNDCDGVPDDDGIGARTFFRDDDDDGFGIETDSVSACTQPEGFASLIGDCDDGDARFNPGALDDQCDGIDQNCDGQPDDGSLLVERYLDADEDGFGTLDSAVFTCTSLDGYVALPGDCDDSDPSIGPSQLDDQCDGVDRDCDGVADDAAVYFVQFRDDDGDNFGRDDDSLLDCTLRPGYALQGGDCADDDATINPIVSDQCDGVDQNCNGLVDENASFRIAYFDDDGDGFGEGDAGVEVCSVPPGLALESGDCDDDDPTLNPAQLDLCDGIDNNCDGVTDNDAVQRLYYEDLDGDGTGNPDVSVSACTAPPGFVLTSGDCDDSDATVEPGNADLCDGRDEDCDGAVDEGATFVRWYQDSDGDGIGSQSVFTDLCDSPPTGWVQETGDCDDSDGQVVVPVWYADVDGDGAGGLSAVQQCLPPHGHVANSEDCDDSTDSRSPFLVEICQNGIDDDCDPGTHCRAEGTLSTNLDPIFERRELPTGADIVVPIPDVIGGPEADFVVSDMNGAPGWFSIVEGSDLLDTTNRFSHGCALPLVFDFTGDIEPEIACEDAGSLKVYQSTGTEFLDAPTTTFTSTSADFFVPHVGRDGISGVWTTNQSDQVVFVPYRPGAVDVDAEYTRTVLGSTNWMPVTSAPCSIGAATDCLLVWTLDGAGLLPLVPGQGNLDLSNAWIETYPPDPTLPFTVLPSPEVIDVTGDGVGDLVYTALGFEGAYWETPQAQLQAPAILDPWVTPYLGQRSGGATTGDMDGDGEADWYGFDAGALLLAFTTAGPPGPHVTVLTPANMAPPRFGDIDADSYADLLLTASLDNPSPGRTPELYILFGSGI